MKKIYILLILIILALITFLALSKSGITSKPLSTFTHSSGAFSFKYPPELGILEREGMVTVSVTGLNDTKSIVSSISPLYYPDYISKFKQNKGAEVKTMVINGNKVVTISYKEYSQYGTQYLIPLEDTENPSSFLVAVALPNTNGFSQDQFDSIFESISIDKEKMDKLIEDIIAMGNARALEAKLKALLSNVRPGAELYYDKASSYINLCNQPSSTKTGTYSVSDSFKGITDEVGLKNLICMAKKDAYAVSIKMPQESFWCVDSTGYMGSTTSMIKGYSCK